MSVLEQLIQLRNEVKELYESSSRNFTINQKAFFTKMNSINETLEEAKDVKKIFSAEFDEKFV